MVQLGELIRTSHEMAMDKGWYSEDRGIPELLCLIHSEISEALEAYRNSNADTPWQFEVDGKPEGVAIELADAVIRIADMCGYLGIDLETAIKTKLGYNSMRPIRHGGKRA